jgi:hypothetical protein
MRFLAVLVLLLPLRVVGPFASAQEPPGRTVATRRADLVQALEVLHAWDTQRATAWAEVDAPALRSLYARGSPAGRADVRLLRAYAARGLVVRRIVTQVFAAKVLHRDGSAMRLRVFDRVAGGEMVHDGHAVPLGSSRPVTRDIGLRVASGRWLVASVSGSGRDLRAARR